MQGKFGHEVSVEFSTWCTDHVFLLPTVEATAWRSACTSFLLPGSILDDKRWLQEDTCERQQEESNRSTEQAKQLGKLSSSNSKT